MGPIGSEWKNNQIAGKSWNHRGQHWALNPMARKPWISHPSVGQIEVEMRIKVKKDTHTLLDQGG